jgi:hypothetical protein
MIFVRLKQGRKAAGSEPESMKYSRFMLQTPYVVVHCYNFIIFVFFGLNLCNDKLQLYINYIVCAICINYVYFCFDRQRDLFQVLKAYSILNSSVGYCQAQAPLAAFLLMHMPAEQAFWCLVSICDKYLGGYYSQGMVSLSMGKSLEGDRCL